jgi:hypothetical protein
MVIVLRRSVTAVALSLVAAGAWSAAACGSSDGDGSGPAPVAPGSDGAAPADVATPDGSLSPTDWTISIDTNAAPAGKLASSLLGQYELSGALFRYDQVPGLAASMKSAGMLDWRVGVGRWEISTRLLPTLTDGSDCTKQLAPLPPEAYAPAGSTDLDLIASRDWFVDDGNAVTLAETQNDARYDLAYVRSVIDVATAFGAAPLVDLDHMPRAFAINRTPSRTVAKIPTACTFSWSNEVSNVRPADAYLTSDATTLPIFASAAAGLVQRVVEGNGAEKARSAALSWEIWNEPELPYAWDPTFDDTNHTQFFTMAAQTLVLLDAYRAKPTSPKGLRFGLGSFAQAAVAAGAITAFDKAAVTLPVDFFSFHSYSNDPLVIVADVAQVIAARAASTHYQSKELALTEWGPDLGTPPDAKTMDMPLLVATVIALAATAGLERTYHSLFYDFYAGLPYGLVDHTGAPKPLYGAYLLLAQTIAGGSDRIAITNHADGKIDDGQGAAIAARDATGKVRVLLVNRGGAARTARIDRSGAAANPAQVQQLDDPTSGVHTVNLAPGANVVTVPARSIVLVEL